MAAHARPNARIFRYGAGLQIRIAIRLRSPQNQNSLAKLFGQISQKGACSEKLPSWNRNEYARVTRMETAEITASAACGTRNATLDQRFRSSATGSASSGTKITADSFDNSARQNDASDAAYHAPPRVSRNRIQQMNASNPNRTSKGSVE